MNDAKSLTYNSNDKNRGEMGYFCDIQTKQKIVETVSRVPLGGCVSRCMPIRAETKAVNASPFRLFCADVLETAKTVRRTNRQARGNSPEAKAVNVSPCDRLALTFWKMKKRQERKGRSAEILQKLRR